MMAPTLLQADVINDNADAAIQANDNEATQQDTNQMLSELKMGVYTRCYCEENIYCLLRNSVKSNLECVAIIISNPKRVVPVWFQKANPEGPICWDYHVACAVKNDVWRIMDFDSSLDWAIPARDWLKLAIFHKPVRKEYQRMFRIIPAKDYLARFSSDRLHMLHNGEWVAPPPSYPPIINGPSNLFSKYVNMDYDESCYGKVYHEAEIEYVFT